MELSKEINYRIYKSMHVDIHEYCINQETVDKCLSRNKRIESKTKESQSKFDVSLDRSIEHVITDKYEKYDTYKACIWRIEHVFNSVI
jgi:hypothetical protein